MNEACLNRTLARIGIGDRSDNANDGGATGRKAFLQCIQRIAINIHADELRPVLGQPFGDRRADTLPCPCHQICV